jgi:hypothetical protein
MKTVDTVNGQDGGNQGHEAAGQPQTDKEVCRVGKLLQQDVSANDSTDKVGLRMEGRKAAGGGISGVSDAQEEADGAANRGLPKERDIAYSSRHEPLNPRTNHGKIRIPIDGRFWPLLLQ